MITTPRFDIGFPVRPQRSNSAPSTSSPLTMYLTTGDDDQISIAFFVPKGGTITKIGWLVGSENDNTGTLDVRLETVDTSTGLPTGTLADTNTRATYTTTATSDTWQEVTLDSGYTATRGEILCVRIKVLTAGNGYSQVEYITGNFVPSSGTEGVFPYLATTTNAGTTWAGKSNIGTPILSIGYSDGTYPSLGQCIMPVSYTGALSFNNTDTPDVIGIRINLDFTTRCAGAWVNFDADGDSVLKLYDSDGVTVIKSFTITEDLPEYGATPCLYEIVWDDYVVLQKNTNYYLAIEPSTSFDCDHIEMVFPSSVVRREYVGADITYCSAKDPTGTGDWTDDETKMVLMGLICDGIETSTGLSTSVTGGVRPTGGGTSW